MRIHINQNTHELRRGATLADAIALVQPPMPFAAAINMTFVPNTRYGDTPLNDGDRIDLIAPVTGG